MLASTLATLAGLATSLAASAAALTAHHLILASGCHVVAAILAGVLARIATVTTSVGHFIFRGAIFFTRVGKNPIFSRQAKVPNRSHDFLCPSFHPQNGPDFRKTQVFYSDLSYLLLLSNE